MAPSALYQHCVESQQERTVLQASPPISAAAHCCVELVDPPELVLPPVPVPLLPPAEKLPPVAVEPLEPPLENEPALPLEPAEPEHWAEVSAQLPSLQQMAVSQ